MLIKFGESGHPVFRATSPLSRGTLESKGCGKLSIHFCADGDTSETVFRTILSVNQLSIYGAVSDLCDEYSTCQARTERLDMVGQSDHCLCRQVRWWQHLHLRLKFLHRKFMAKVQRTSGKASTTRSIDKVLYWCWIPDNSWRRTSLHDKKTINLDPKIQIKYFDTKRPTRRHTDQGKFHTWWKESFFVFV